MSYKHLTIKEREILMFLRAKGLSIRAVALRLGRNPSTISRELKRCAGNYSPSKADNDYHQKRQNCHKKRLLDSDPQLRRQIVHYILDLHWSPEQITARFNKDLYWCVSYNTIYRHIYHHVRSTLQVVLPVFSAISDINVVLVIQRIIIVMYKNR